MGFFSKKNKENNGFIINTDDEVIKVQGEQNLAPHAITPEEVSDLWIFGDEDETYTKSNALDSLKKRMNVSSEENATVQQTQETKETVNFAETQETIKELIEQVKTTSADENGNTIKSQEKSKQSEEQPKVIIKPKKTLVEKVKRYTVDEQGNDATETEEPIYKLQSVAEILMSDGESAMKDLSKKYGLDIISDDLDNPQEENTKFSKETNKQKTTNQTSKKIEKPFVTAPTPAFEKMVSDSEERESRELYESLFPNNKKIDVPDISVPDISDIDTNEVGIEQEETISNTATIRFTPIKDKKGNTDHITISNITKHIDLSDSLPQDVTNNTVTDLEESEFDNFEPDCEYTDVASGKKIMMSLAKKKRSFFISTLISFAMVIALSVFLLPPIYNFILSSNSTMFICTAFLLVSVVANYDMFLDFKNLIKKRSCFDVLASLCSVLTITLGITAAFTNENAYYSILLCAIILFTRVLFKFKEISAQQKSLKRIIGDKPKNALSLISDPATTFAMAKNTVDGDVLIAAPRKTQFVEDFMKHYKFHKTLSGKMDIVFYLTLALSLVSALVAYFIQDGIFGSIYAASSIACISTLPTAFFIDTLVFSTATKKLGISGSAISGLYGAEKIEDANAAVINIKDIFPSGTVSMHNMKVLSNNNIDDILLRAASLTSAVGSPLESIFKTIAGTNTSYSIPNSDTVKYEKNLGISGWVNDELLFIGNRSLMMAHGIDIPSLEVDKKILRKGYFPVYVATENAACALIVIQYNVDETVAKQLHKINNLGITLLVENCDPNVTGEMLCDYFGLYDDSVKIMSSAGVYMYNNAVPFIKSFSSPAVFRGSGLNFIKVINCASGIKKCNRLLTILYVVFAILGALCFVYAAFSGLMSIPAQETVLLYALGTTVLSIIGFLIRKP